METEKLIMRCMKRGKTYTTRDFMKHPTLQNLQERDVLGAAWRLLLEEKIVMVDSRVQLPRVRRCEQTKTLSEESR